VIITLSPADDVDELAREIMSAPARVVFFVCLRSHFIYVYRCSLLINGA